MTDASTVALNLDPADYTEGDEIKVTTTGTVIRTTSTDEVTSLDGTLGNGDHIHADKATVTHYDIHDMGPVKVGSVNSPWVIAGDELSASRVADLTESTVVVQTLLADRSTGPLVSKKVPPGKPKPPPVATFPGDVQTGTIHLGVATGNNGDPKTRFETQGHAVGIRRTYYDLNSTNITKAVNIVKADGAAGRGVSWISFKPNPYTWDQIGNGTTADATIRGLINQLKAVPQTVWLTPHHEPDEEYGGSRGTLDQWKAMNLKYRKLIDESGATNIALAPIWMAWSWTKTVTGNHKATDAWFVPNCWDFLGIDAYWQAGAPTDDGNGLALFQTWAQKWGLKLAVGEYGYHDVGTAQQANFLQTQYDKFIAARYIGAAYFDLGASLLGGPSLTKFQNLVALPTSV